MPFSKRSGRKRSTGSTKASRRTRSRTPSAQGPCSPRRAPLRADPMPCLRQEQISRQSLHHAREARGRGRPGAGGLQQLHAAGSHEERRTERPDPERREVAQLQEWFETHWNEASEVAVIDLTPYAPVFAIRRLREGPAAVLPGARADRDRVGRDTVAHVPDVDRYQKEAYWALMKIARQHGGAFLCDGVGLGKTFVGLMLIERLILHEGKRVALFAPKAAKEGVWEPHLRRWLPHIGGVGGGADFSNLAVFSHTDLGRKGDFPERFQRIANSLTSSSSTRRTTSAIRAAGVTPTGESNRRATTACSSCSTTRNAPRPCSC